MTDFNESYFIAAYRCGDMEFSNPGRIGIYFDDYDILVGASHREKPHLYSCVNEPDSAWVNVVIDIASSGNNLKLRAVHCAYNYHILCFFECVNRK